MSNRSHVLVDSSAWFLNTSPLNKTLSTRPQVSRNRYGPSNVPSASKMKQRISEAFGSSKNIIYSDQHPDPGVPETDPPVDLLSHRSTSLLHPRRSLLSNSPSKRAAGRRHIPSPLPPSSPPTPSSGDDETEEPARFPYRDTTRKHEPEDPYGLLRGHQRFSRLRHRRRQKFTVAAPPKRILALVRFENLSPATPCAKHNASPGQRHSGSVGILFPGASGALSHHAGCIHSVRGAGDGGNRNENGKTPDPDGSGGCVVSGASETLSNLLARLPRARACRSRRPPPRQDLDQDNRAMSVLTITEAPKRAEDKKKNREKLQKKKRAEDEASHLIGEARVAYEERRDARLAHYRTVDGHRLHEEDVLWI